MRKTTLTPKGLVSHFSLIPGWQLSTLGASSNSRFLEAHKQIKMSLALPRSLSNVGHQLRFQVIFCCPSSTLSYTFSIRNVHPSTLLVFSWNLQVLRTHLPKWSPQRWFQTQPVNKRTKLLAEKKVNSLTPKTPLGSFLPLHKNLQCFLLFTEFSPILFMFSLL